MIAPTMPVLETHTDGRPILRGRIYRATLNRHRSDPSRNELVLGIVVSCPFCRKRNGRPVKHFHGWDPANGFNVLTHRAADCGSGPLLRCGYYLGLDPEADHVIVPGTKMAIELAEGCRQ